MDPTWNTSGQLAAVSFFAGLKINGNGEASLVGGATAISELPAAGETIDNHTFHDGIEHAPIYTEATSLRVAVLLAMAAASLIGNAATMWNIKKSCISRRVTRHSWSAVYFLIFHLAVADLLVTGFCIFGEAAWSYSVDWRAGVVACKLLKFLQMFSLYLSTFVLVLIGVDRWIAVKYPWKSLHMMRRCYRLMGLAYVLAAGLSVPQLFIFDVARGPFEEEFYQCVTYNFYTAYWQEQAYTTFTLMFMFVIPLVVLCSTYVSTFRTIAASERMFPSAACPPTNPPCSNNANATAQQQPDLHRTEFNGMDQGQSTIRQQLINRAKVKSLRISVAIVLAFIVCWSPYYVMMLTYMFHNPDQKYSDGLQSGIFFFGMSNSVVNPLVYGVFHLWPMRRKEQQTGRDASSHKTAMSTMTTMRHQESRTLISHGRNPSDGSIISAKKCDSKTAA